MYVCTVLYRSNVNVTSMKNWSERTQAHTHTVNVNLISSVTDSLALCMFTVHMSVRFIWPIGTPFKFFHVIRSFFLSWYVTRFDLFVNFGSMQITSKPSKSLTTRVRFRICSERLFHFEITYSNRQSVLCCLGARIVHVWMKPFGMLGKELSKNHTHAHATLNIQLLFFNLN